MAETADDSLNARLSQLAEMITTQSSSLNIQHLLDAFVVLYDECNTPGVRCLNRSVIEAFLDKYKDQVAAIRSLRVQPDDFEFLELIGRGNFGEVQLVKHKTSQRPYALKMLSKCQMMNQSNTAFFWEEQQVMALANSDWVVRLYNAFQDDKYLYLLMEFVPGGDLVTLMAKYPIFTERVARMYIAEAITAVDTLHQLGFVHRDVKPDNLLVDRSGHLKLADFGTCTRVDAEGRVHCDGNSEAVGTPDYISPEVLDSHMAVTSYTRSCDWWSIGIVLYEMLHGDPPFYSESLLGMYGEIRNHERSLRFPGEVELAPATVEFIRALITGPDQRLDIDGIRQHGFFTGLDWTTLRDQPPPFDVELQHATDTSNFDEIDEPDAPPQFFKVPRAFTGNHLPFIGYSYDRDGILLGGAAPSSSTTTTAGKGASADELARHKKETDELRVKLDSATKELAEAAAKNREVTRRVDGLQRQAARSEELEQANARLSETIATSEVDSEATQKKLEAESKARASAEERLAELQQRLDAAEHKADDTASQQEAESVRAARDKAESELEKLRARVAELDEAAALHELETRELRDQVTKLESDATSAKTELEKQSVAFAEESSAHHGAVKAGDEARGRVAALTKEVEKLRASLETESSARTTAQQLKAVTDKEIASLRHDLTESEAKVASTDAKLTAAEARLAQALESAAASAVAALPEAGKEAEQLAQQLKESKEASAAAETRAQDAARALSTMQVDAEETARALREMTAARDALTAQLEAQSADLENLMLASGTLSESNAVLQQKCDRQVQHVTELKAKLASTEEERAAAKASATEHKRRFVVADCKCKELLAMHDILKTERKTLEARIEENVATHQRALTAAESGRSALEQQVTELRASVATAEERASAVEGKYNKMQKEKARLQVQVSSLSQRNEDDRAKLADAEKQVSELDASLVQAEQALAELESTRQALEKDKTNVTEELYERTEEVETLTTAKVRLQSERDAYKQKLDLAVTKVAELGTQQLERRHGGTGPVANWREKNKAAKRDKQFMVIAKKLQSKEQEVTTLKMKENLAREAMEEWRHKFEVLQLDLDDLKKTKSAVQQTIELEQNRLSRGSTKSFSPLVVTAALMASGAAREDQSLMGWLETPEGSSGNKLRKGKGWSRRFVVVTAKTIVLYASDAREQPLTTVDLRDVIFVRNVTKADLVHVSEKDLERIFQVLYNKSGEIGGATSRPKLMTLSGVKTREVKGHEFVSSGTVFKHNYVCQKCNMTLSHKTEFQEVAPCLVDLETSQHYFMAPSTDDCLHWMDALKALIGKCKEDTKKT